MDLGVHLQSDLVSPQATTDDSFHLVNLPGQCLTHDAESLSSNGLKRRLCVIVAASARPIYSAHPLKFE